jgi:hypothetical protein
MSLKFCFKCAEPVKQTVRVCPACGTESFVYQKPRAESNEEVKEKKSEDTKVFESAYKNFKVDSSANLERNDSKFDSDYNLMDVVFAQNRTTHAVRAFVRFLFIQLSGITLAIILWNISIVFIDQQECIQYGDKCTGNGFFQFLAAAVLIVSVVWSSYAGWNELDKSNIDEK